MLDLNLSIPGSNTIEDKNFFNSFIVSVTLQSIWKTVQSHFQRIWPFTIVSVAKKLKRFIEERKYSAIQQVKATSPKKLKTSVKSAKVAQILAQSITRTIHIIERKTFVKIIEVTQRLKKSIIVHEHLLE